jgi:lipoprotein-anchoring transpeptidase ErfK/SrfK
VAPLGRLYRPVYFYGGYAVHGSGSIPAYPASHGCARVSNPAIDMIWRENLMPDGLRVLVRD